MKITNIDRMTHRMINDRIAKALKDLGDELGMDFEAHGGQYGGTQGNFRIQGTVRQAAGGISGAEAEFKRWAPIMGLPADAYGKQIVLGRDTYTIVGVNPNAHKNCIKILRNYDKKTFVCPLSSVLHQLPRAAA